jgi:hypothetical protein
VEVDQGGGGRGGAEEKATFGAPPHSVVKSRDDINSRRHGAGGNGVRNCLLSHHNIAS